MTDEFDDELPRSGGYTLRESWTEGVGNELKECKNWDLSRIFWQLSEVYEFIKNNAKYKDCYRVQIMQYQPHLVIHGKENQNIGIHRIVRVVRTTKSQEIKLYPAHSSATPDQEITW